MAMSVALLLLLLLHFTTSEHDDYNNVARYDNTDMHDINASEIDKQTTHTYKAITDTLTDTLRSLIETKTNSHDPLFPLTTSDYLGLTFSVLGLLLAAGGGIGGGGILVPIYTLIMGFSPKHAIPLSNVTVFGGSLANCWLNSGKRHPSRDRGLVDWDLILVMEPVTILGALGGAMLNKVLPSTLLSVLLVLLLTATATNTCNKAKKMWLKEEEAIKRKGGLEDMTRKGEVGGVEMVEKDENEIDIESPIKTPKGSEVGPGEGEGGEADDGEEHGDDEDDDTDATTSLLSPSDRQTNIKTDSRTFDPELQSVLLKESQTPWNHIIALTLLFIVILTINLLKGGGGWSPVGIKCGSRGFWISNAAMVLAIVGFTAQVRTYLGNQHKLKTRLNYPYASGDIKWTPRNTVLYPALCTVAGIFAGMFGIGGGIVKGPLMLALNVHPAVSSATSAQMILFTSFTATTSFYVFGLLLPGYAGACAIVGFLATYAGQVIMTRAMEKNERNSYIAFSIGGVVAVSAALMGLQAALMLAEGKVSEGGGMCRKDN